jgi:hypothetical protein
MNYKLCGTKRSWLILKYYLSHILEVMTQTSNNSSREVENNVTANNLGLVQGQILHLHGEIVGNKKPQPMSVLYAVIIIITSEY